MIHHLRAAGVSVLLDSRGTEVPALLHWGEDLGEISDADCVSYAEASLPATAPSSIDRPFRQHLVASLSNGWSGMPSLTVAGGAPTLHHQGTIRRDDTLEIVVASGDARIDLKLTLTRDGVLLVEQRITNAGNQSLRLRDSAIVLPISANATEVLDFAGNWTHERAPQRIRPGRGVWSRESRHGRGGHDDAFLMMAGTAGFDFRHGQIWSTHVAWSGDTRQWYERSPLGSTTLGAGERFSEVTIAPGAQYSAPQVVATYSDAGIDGLSDRLHQYVRRWAGARGARPLTLNTWEAVYFDQSIERLEPLVEAAALVGIERFVLDDGWFHGRTDDKRALGDWTVDAARWPDGLGPLTDRVIAAGMQFGLWVEPEMVSLDSDLAREHPEWLLTNDVALTWRWQHVLDLSLIEVRDYLFTRLHALLCEYPISYLKWDHNRDLLVDNTRDQVAGLYSLLDEIRAAHPRVEIESCASGGGRVDLGILRRVDRFWPSDSNDPLERQRIQRWTGVLIPPEFLGSHVGDARAHTTGRVSELSFRLATALFAHAGIEADLTRISDVDRSALARWAEIYKEHRHLLHSGRAVRTDEADDSVLVHGIVSRDQREALYSYAAMAGFGAALAPTMKCAGLDASRRYRVEVVDFGVTPTSIQDAPPQWLGAGTTLPGSVLLAGGLAMPLLAPGNAIVLSVRAV
ncbi:alpha-galactosidase [Microbacterium sp. R86528]|uniref:alpha-galactosidase n=1 Tax=Microbacterium sp. R86528 TaxID=3093864 RepID=UPI0037CC4DBE